MKTLYFSLKKLQKWQKLKLSGVTWVILPTCICCLLSVQFLCFVFLLRFFPRLNLMGIILRVFQRINLHRTFLEFYFLLPAIKIGGNCVDKDRRCSGWTRYCSYHRYVRANCKKTCKLCWARENGGKLLKGLFAISLTTVFPISDHVALKNVLSGAEYDF